MTCLLRKNKNPKKTICHKALFQSFSSLLALIIHSVCPIIMELGKLPIISCGKFLKFLAAIPHYFHQCIPETMSPLKAKPLMIAID